MIENIQSNVETDAAKLALKLYNLEIEIKSVKKQLQELTVANNMLRVVKEDIANDNKAKANAPE